MYRSALVMLFRRSRARSVCSECTTPASPAHGQVPTQAVKSPLTHLFRPTRRFAPTSPHGGEVNLRSALADLFRPTRRFAPTSPHGGEVNLRNALADLFRPTRRFAPTSPHRGEVNKRGTSENSPPHPVGRSAPLA